MIVATLLLALNYSEYFQFSTKQIMVLPLFTRYGIFIFLVTVEARGSKHVTTRGVTDWTATRRLGQ